jgi:hypothetical protein
MGIDYTKLDLKSIIATIVGVAAVVLNQKLGLGLSDTDKEYVTAMIAAYVSFGHIKDAIVAHADAKGQAASDKVVTVEDAKKVING